MSQNLDPQGDSYLKEILEDPQTRYGSAMDHILEGCQIISRDFHYLYVNDTVAKQGKTKKDKLIGRTMMECYPGIEKTPLFKKIKDCILNKNVQLFENEFTFPDKSLGWFELRIEPLPEGCIILSMDITERKKAEKQKEALIQATSEKLPKEIEEISAKLQFVFKDKSLKMPQRKAIEEAQSLSQEIDKQVKELNKSLKSA